MLATMITKLSFCWVSSDFAGTGMSKLTCFAGGQSHRKLDNDRIRLEKFSPKIGDRVSTRIGVFDVQEGRGCPAVLVTSVRQGADLLVVRL